MVTNDSDHSYTQANNSGCILKIGEIPPFGPHTPPRLMRMIQDDRELFLKGRRCESQGLGVGAFSYYRRVVEHQRDRIIDETIRVAEKLGYGDDIITPLKAAKIEKQFMKSMEMIKEVTPDSMKIFGENPFSLLHSALSHGLHNETDEFCLEIAQSTRLILVEFAERLGQLMTDNAELKKAVTILSSARGKK